MDEVPAYHPSGRGDHIFLRIRKRQLDTQQAAGRIARALGCDPKAVGWAGLKDRQAVTTQWLSIFGADPDAARALVLPGIEVLEVERHPHKLRTGHLRENVFSLRVHCDPGGLAIARQVVDALLAHGLPNFYGEQRFGRDNLLQARRWLLQGGRAPRDRFTRKLLISVLQAAVFNDWLAARMQDGLFERAVSGDLMRKEDTGGLFVGADADEAQRRMAAWEISPTGPIFGCKMRSAESAAAEREQQTLARWQVSSIDPATLRKLAPGTRRSARVRPARPSVEADAQGLRLRFGLPPGAYATVLLREILKPGEG